MDTTMSIEQLLDEVCDTLRAAEERQRTDHPPAHEDFYAWGSALDQLTYRLGGAVRTLHHQVQAYGDRRILRDDEGSDPAARLAEADEYLDALSVALEEASKWARSYHSSIGHIAVEVDPDTAPDTD